MTNKERLSLAKRALYAELLRLSDEEVTENELKLMHLLAKDKQIQQALDEAFKQMRNEKSIS